MHACTHEQPAAIRCFPSIATAPRGQRGARRSRVCARCPNPRPVKVPVKGSARSLQPVPEDVATEEETDVSGMVSDVSRPTPGQQAAQQAAATSAGGDGAGAGAGIGRYSSSQVSLQQPTVTFEALPTPSAGVPASVGAFRPGSAAGASVSAPARPGRPPAPGDASLALPVRSSVALTPLPSMGGHIAAAQQLVGLSPSSSVVLQDGRAALPEAMRISAAYSLAVRAQAQSRLGSAASSGGAPLLGGASAGSLPAVFASSSPVPTARVPAPHLLSPSASASPAEYDTYRAGGGGAPAPGSYAQLLALPLGVRAVAAASVAPPVGPNSVSASLGMLPSGALGGLAVAVRQASPSPGSSPHAALLPRQARPLANSVSVSRLWGVQRQNLGNPTSSVNLTHSSSQGSPFGPPLRRQ